MKRRDALFGAAAGSVALAARAMLPASEGGSGNAVLGAAAVATRAGDRGRKPGERISILDFGADPTGATPCDGALANAIRSVGIGQGKFNIGGPHIYFPPGTYRFAKTIELKRTVILEGDAVGAAGGYASVLTFPPNTTGIIVQRYNTMGMGLESVSTLGGDGSIIRNLQLIGSKASSTSGHGIWLRARATIEQVNIKGFKEHGVQVLAAARTTLAKFEGNANDFYVGQCTIILNDGCGIYVKGADANAGVVINTSCSHNGAWGFYDSSFLGNTYIGCHTEGNGSSSQVSDGTNRYYVLDDTHGGATRPGTNPQVWAVVGPGGVHPAYPLWAAGTGYATGGSYKSDNPNARNSFIGCYTESGQAPPDVRYPAMVIGGAFSRQRASGTAFMLSAVFPGGLLTHFAMEQKTGSSRGLNALFAQNPEQPITVTAEGDHVHGFAPLAWDEATGQWIAVHGGNPAHPPVRYTTNLNKAQFGRSAAVVGGQVAFAQGIWLGSSLASARYFGNGAASPTTGEHALGDRIFNSAPAVGKPKSWVCVAAGTPGTWISEGNL